MVASIALGRGGKGLFRGSRARKKPSPLRPGGGFFYRPGAGRRPISDGITSLRHHHVERVTVTSRLVRGSNQHLDPDRGLCR
jgi:hypothetical protein